MKFILRIDSLLDNKFDSKVLKMSRKTASCLTSLGTPEKIMKSAK